MSETPLSHEVLSRSALVIVDMNRAHLDHETGHLLVEQKEAERVVSIAADLLGAWRQAGLPVVFVRTHHRWNSATGEVIDNKNPFWLWQQSRTIPGLNRKRTSRAVEGSPVTEVMPQLAPRPGEHTVFKHRYSPFHNTDMELLLKNLEVDSLIVGGINTNNCVLCTCFEAFNRDFRVFLVEDMCASMNGPDYNEAALKLIEAALAWRISSSDLIELCRQRAAA